MGFAMNDTLSRFLVVLGVCVACATSCLGWGAAAYVGTRAPQVARKHAPLHPAPLESRPDWGLSFGSADGARGPERRRTSEADAFPEVFSGK